MPSGPHKRAALRKRKQRRQQQQQQQQQRQEDHSKSGDDAGSVEEEEEEEGLVSPGTPVTDRESPVVPLPSPLADTETADWIPVGARLPKSDGRNEQEEQEHVQMQEHITATEEEEGQHRQPGEQEKGGQALLKPHPAAGCSCGILDWLLGRD